MGEAEEVVVNVQPAVRLHRGPLGKAHSLMFTSRFGIPSSAFRSDPLPLSFEKLHRTTNVSKSQFHPRYRFNISERNFINFNINCFDSCFCNIF